MELGIHNPQIILGTTKVPSHHGQKNLSELWRPPRITEKNIRQVSFRTSFHVDLVQAALGVVEEVVLDDAVQAFFDSPEIGLIRAKEVL